MSSAVQLNSYTSSTSQLTQDLNKSSSGTPDVLSHEEKKPRIKEQIEALTKEMKQEELLDLLQGDLDNNAVEISLLLIAQQLTSGHEKDGIIVSIISELAKEPGAIKSVMGIFKSEYMSFTGLNHDLINDRIKTIVACASIDLMSVVDLLSGIVPETDQNFIKEEICKVARYHAKERLLEVAKLLPFLPENDREGLIIDILFDLTQKARHPLFSFARLLAKKDLVAAADFIIKCISQQEDRKKAMVDIAYDISKSAVKYMSVFICALAEKDLVAAAHFIIQGISDQEEKNEAIQSVAADLADSFSEPLKVFVRALAKIDLALASKFIFILSSDSRVNDDIINYVAYDLTGNFTEGASAIVKDLIKKKYVKEAIEFVEKIVDVRDKAEATKLLPK